MPSAINRRAVAHHEAGHVIVGRALGREVEHVTIAEDVVGGMSRSGHVTFAPMPPLASLPYRARIAAQKERFLDSMVVSSAGRIAQRIGCPRSRFPSGAIVDDAEVDRIADLLAGSPQAARALRTYAEREARAMVERNWPLIRAIAAGLVERTTLSAADVEQLVAPIEAERAMQLDAYVRQYGLPDAEQVEQYRAERVARSRTVERRHVAEGVLRTILHRIGTGDQSPITGDDLDAAVRQHATTTGRDPDIAARKLWAAHSRQAEALKWRTVKPTMALTSTRRH